MGCNTDLEKMIDIKEYKKITKHITGVYLIKTVDFILAFIFFVILSRFLSQKQFGIYSILNVSLLILSGLLGFGLAEFIVRDLTGKREAIKKERFRQIFTFIFWTIIIIITLLILFAYLILSYLDYTELFFPIFVVIFCSGIIVIGRLIIHYLHSKKNIIGATLLDFLFRTMWVLPLILFIFTLTINTIFLTRFLYSIILFFIVIYYFKWKKLRFLGRINKNYIKKALIFGIPISTLMLSQSIITASDRYILGFFHSATQVGYYAYIYRILNFIMVFSIFAVSTTIYPYIVESYNKGNKEKSNFLLNSLLKYNLIIIVPVLMGFFILSKEILTSISGTRYLATIPIIPFLIFFPLIQSIYIIYHYTLLLKNKTKTIMIIFGTGMLLNIILNFILIPQYHYFGAAVATIITYICLLVLFYLATRKYIKLDYKYLKLTRIMISAVIMALAISFFHPQNILTKLITICFGAVIYLLALFITKAYIKEEIELIKSYLPYRK